MKLDALDSRLQGLGGSRVLELTLYDRGKGLYGYSAMECDLGRSGPFTTRTYSLFQDPSARAGIRIGTRSTPKGKAEAVRILGSLTDWRLDTFPAELAQIAPGVTLAYHQPNRAPKDWTPIPQQEAA